MDPEESPEDLLAELTAELEALGVHSSLGYSVALDMPDPRLQEALDRGDRDLVRAILLEQTDASAAVIDAVVETLPPAE